MNDTILIKKKTVKSIKGSDRPKKQQQLVRINYKTACHSAMDGNWHRSWNCCVMFWILLVAVISGIVAQNNCVKQDCEWAEWQLWSDCTHQCGATGETSRVRYQTRAASCGGLQCQGKSREKAPCNRGCNFGGILSNQDGVCLCPNNRTGKCCELAADNCQTTVCINGGTCVIRNGDEMCKCRQFYEGNRCQINQTPAVFGISPNYGPEAGGTLVLFRGRNLAILTRVEITIGPKDCTLIQRSQTAIICSTPIANITGDRLRLPIIFLSTPLPEGLKDMTFTYLPNPKFNNIYPRKMPISGGTELTVKGNNLDSVAGPIMKTSVEDETKRVYYTRCKPQSDHSMVCETPNLGTPGGNSGTTPSTEDEESLLNIRISFILDGFTLYQNPNTGQSNSSVPGLGIVEVYRDPIIHKFRESNHVRVFNPYRVSYIEILGARLDDGVSAHHYTIRIGRNASCLLSDLTSNRIECSPPLVQPAHGKSAFHGHLSVVVYVGNIRTAVGYLDYEHSLGENGTFPYSPGNL